MVTYAITGATGFLGWHVRCRLHAMHPGVQVRPIDRETLSDDQALANALTGADAVLHLAAVNSHDDAATMNVEITERLLAGLDRLHAAPHVVFSNSLHVERDTPYGRSKHAVGRAIESWAERVGATFADVVLPNLFGEGGRPFYNSAVATLCNALVSGGHADVNDAGTTELLHAQDASAILLNQAARRTNSRQRIRGEIIGIPALYDRLAYFFGTYSGTQTIPELRSRLDLHLFNQLRTAMFPDAYPMPLFAHEDERGVFFEAVRGWGASQASFSTTVPGVTRGEHFHFDKIERFVVVRGGATIEIRRLLDDVIHTFHVSDDRPAVVDMPTLHTHNITNVGSDELLTMFWTNDHFDPDHPDTYTETVRPAEALL